MSVSAGGWRRARPATLVVLTAALTVAAVAATRSQDEELQLQRGRGQALYEEKVYDQAEEAFAAVTASGQATAQDWLNLALARYERGDDVGTLAAVDRAAALDSRQPGVYYVRGLVAKRSDDIQAALAAFRRAAELDPADPAIRYNLGWALETSGDTEGAVAQYGAVIQMGFDIGLQHTVSSLYRRGFIRVRAGDREGGQADLLRSRELGQRLSQAQRAPAALEAGRYKRVVVPAISVVGPLAGARDGVRLDEESVSGGASGVLVDLRPDGGDLVRLGPGGGVTRSDGVVSSQALPDGPAALGDHDRDGDADLIVATGSELSLWRGSEDAGSHFTEEDAEGLPAVAAVTSVGWVDADHDGDLDVVVTQSAGPGLRLIDNRGGATFVEVTRQAEVGEETPSVGVVWADFDGDHDVDLYALRSTGPNALYSNSRDGTFAEIAAAVGAGGPGATVAAVAEDLDNDGDIDLALLAPGELTLLANDGDGTFASRGQAPAVRGGRTLAAADMDNDGWLDLVVEDADGIRWWANAGGLRFEDVGRVAAAGTRLVTAADLDANGGVDVVGIGADGIRLWSQPRPVGHWLEVALEGDKNNARGIGSELEVRAGGLYELRPLRAGRAHFGLGARDEAEVVRVTWPNGIVQNEIDVTGDRVLGPLAELERLEGSCPLLYTWDGERWRFVNEVLGVAPLGMPLAAGVIHPADYDEYVPLPGEALAERDGAYELRFTEELREAGYLDAIRLLAVDHPQDTRVVPDEKFIGPPRPEFRLLSVSAPRPVGARDQDGRDWTAALAAVDGDWTRPFKRDRYEGLATPHWLQLELPEARPGSVVRLFLTGWVYWATGSINVVVDEDPRVSFTPVSVQVPDGHGGWRTAIDDIGLPNAKNSTLAVDLTGLLPAGDRRVRIGTTLRLYWDAAFYTVGGELAGGLRPTGDWQQAWGVPRPGTMRLESIDGTPGRLPRVHVVAPLEAEIRYRGFSRLVRGADGFESYDYASVVNGAPWDQHPGMYTRYGPVGALLQQADDRYVIVGTGDEVAVRFPATLPAPPPGWRRDWLVYLNGWVKDGDPNTVYGDRVEPLPFHAMRGYPYGRDQAFPDSPPYRVWQERYNTRPARRINPALSPVVAPLPDLEAER